MAVQAFVDGRIGFTKIVQTVEAVINSLRATGADPLRDLADVTAIEDDARRTAHELLKKVG